MSEPGPDDVVVRTERLDVVGHWAPEHLDAFAVLNADPEVMTFLGGPVGREDSDAFAAYGQRWVAEGLGLLPVVRRDDGVLVGMCGMHRHRWCPDDVEVGWRFARHAWGHGYATEAAAAWLGRGFAELGLTGVISIIDLGNVASVAVARRLGMGLDHVATHTTSPHRTSPHMTSAQALSREVEVAVYRTSARAWRNR